MGIYTYMHRFTYTDTHTYSARLKVDLGGDRHTTPQVKPTHPHEARASAQPQMDRSLSAAQN